MSKWHAIAFSPDKFAIRSLAQASPLCSLSTLTPLDLTDRILLARQSLAREFGPKNIHVAHTIIDGLIDTDRVRSMVGETEDADGRISPDEIGKAYVYLHEQARSAWSHELDMRWEGVESEGGYGYGLTSWLFLSQALQGEFLSARPRD